MTKSTGAICRTVNLPYVRPCDGVIDAASRITYDKDRYISGWSFVTQWLDAPTAWRSEDGEAAAIVRTDGSVSVRGRGSE